MVLFSSRQYSLVTTPDVPLTWYIACPNKSIPPPPASSIESNNLLLPAACRRPRERHPAGERDPDGRHRAAHRPVLLGPIPHRHGRGHEPLQHEHAAADEERCRSCVWAAGDAGDDLGPGLQLCLLQRRPERRPLHLARRRHQSERGIQSVTRTCLPFSDLLIG